MILTTSGYGLLPAMLFAFTSFFLTPSVSWAMPSDFKKEKTLAPIIGDPNSGSVVLNVAYGQATGKVQINFDAAGNGTFTLTMPTGIRYVPGSMTFTATSGAVIAESNITNLAAPVFSITGATVGGSVTVSYGLRAICGAVTGSNSIAVSATVNGTTGTGSISLTVRSAALSITAHSPYTYSRGAAGTVNITITNGGNGQLDSLTFYIRRAESFLTDSVTVGGIKLPFIRTSTNGDTSFYGVPSALLPGGTLDNGESLVLTRYFRAGTCSKAGNTTFPNFQDTYFTNFGVNGSACQSPIPTAFGQFNFNAASTGEPYVVTSRVAILQNANGCQLAREQFRHINNGTGNLAFATAYNVGAMIEDASTGGGHTGWPLGGFLVDSIILLPSGINIPVINGGKNNTTGLCTAPFNNLPALATDPDGAGVGLADMDGDGFFDDLPVGKSVDYIIVWRYPNRNLCLNPASTGERKYVSLISNNICGGGGGYGRFNEAWANNAGSGGSVVVLSSPAQLSSGQVGTLQIQESITYPSRPALSCPVNQFQVRVPLAAGMSVVAIRLDNTPLTVNVVNDTAFVVLTGSGTVEIDFRMISGVTPNGTAPYFEIVHICSSGCDEGRRIVACGNGQPIAIPGTSPCNFGGGTISNSTVKRTTAGYTDNTATAKVDLTTVSPVNLKRGLPNDSIQVTATGVMSTGTVIVGGEDVYYKVSYSLYSGARLVRWVGGTYTSSGVTVPLPVPAYEGDFGGSHIVMYKLGSFFSGTNIDVALRGVILGPAALTNTLESMTGFNNSFVCLAAGATNPSPNGGDTPYTCNSEALEFYVRDPNGAFVRQFAEGFNMCTDYTTTSSGKKYFLRGNEAGSEMSSIPGGIDIDYFPGEVRPLVLLDSIVINLPTGTYRVPGFDVVYVNGRANTQGYNGSGVASFNPGTPIITGNKLKWVNNGTWKVPDDVLTGGFILTTRLGQTCDNNITSVTVPITYYGKDEANGDISLARSFVQTAGLSVSLTKPSFTVNNLSGTQVGDQETECFDLQIVLSGATANNAYMSFPGSGGNFTIASVVNTATGTPYTLLSYSGGHWIQLGNLAPGTYTLRVCSKYASCSAANIQYLFSYDCTGYPANPSLANCASQSGSLPIVPVLADMQSQMLTQPVFPVNMCQSQVYTFQMSSTLGADLRRPRFDVTLPTGLTVSQIRIEYPLNSGTWQTVTPPATTGAFTLPLKLHTGIKDSLPGVNFAPAVNPRTARVELTTVTSCDFTSGNRIEMRALGDAPCGSTAQSNNTPLFSEPIIINGAVQDYFSVFNAINVGSDTIITCEDQTVNVQVTVFDNPSIAGGSSLQPSTDSIFMNFPAGIQYKAGSYSCSSGTDCPLTPIVKSNGNLSFPIPAGGINIPANGSVTLNFSVAINAVVDESCGVPGKLELLTVRSVSGGIACASEPTGFCPSAVQFTTGRVDTTIVAQKATINNFAVSSALQGGTFTYSGSFQVNNQKIPAGQDLVAEVFCVSNGVASGAPIATHSFNGQIATGTTLTFTGSITDACASDSLMFRIAPTLNSGAVQCACSTVSIIEAIPDINTRDTAICAGQSVNLATLITQNALTGTISYHNTYAQALALTSPISSTVTPSVSTEYFVRKSKDADDFDIDSIDVTINPVPDLTARDTSICAGNSVNLSLLLTDNGVTATKTYYATYADAVAKMSALASPTVTPVATAEYFIRMESAAGCFDIDSIDITLNQTPDLSAIDATVCEDALVNLSSLFTANAVSGTTTYYSTYADAVAETNSIFPIFSIANTSEYFIRRETPAGCFDIDSTDITVLSGSNLIARDTAICLGGAANLATLYIQDASAFPVNFYPTFADAQAETNALAATTVTPSVSKQYFLRKNSSTSCFDIDSINVTVNPVPDLMARDTAVCVGRTVNLTTLFTQDATVSAIQYFTNFTDAQARTNAMASTTVTATTTAKYFVRKTYLTGCFDIDSINVTANPIPDLVARDTTICLGSVVNLATLFTQDATSATITYYATYSDATSKTAAISASITPSVTTKYFIRKETPGACFDIDSTNVTVNPNPDLVARDTAICVGSTVDLATLYTQDAASGTITYYANYADALNKTSAITATVTPSVTSEYFIRKELATGCFDIDSVDVTMNPNPDLVARDTAICVGGSVDLATLYTQDATSGTITYYSNYADALNKTSAITATVTPSVTSEYFIRKELATGCFDIDSVDIDVHIIPVVTSVVKVDPTIASCPNLDNGSITVTATGANLRYSKNGGSTWQTSNTFTGLGGISYTITIQDSVVGCSVDTAIILTDPSCNIAPTITSAASVTVAENSTGTAYATTATDPDAGQTLTYSFETGGADNAQFTINPTTGAVIFNTSPNYESPTDAGSDNVYNIKVKVCDNGTPQLCATKDVAITVTDVNECPIPTVGGSTTTALTLPICSILNTGTVTLSGHTGKIIRWETSTNGGVTWTPIADTTTTHRFLNAANNQQYRAVLNNQGTCVDAVSSATTITTSPVDCCNSCDSTATAIFTPGSTCPEQKNRFALTDTFGIILQITPTPQYAGLSPNWYYIYAISYDSTLTINGLTVGADIDTLNGSCVEVAIPMPYQVCPSANLVARDTAICVGGSVDLAILYTQDAASGTITYYPTFADAQAKTNVLSSAMQTPSVTTKYFIRKELSTGCFDIDSTNVTVNPNPDLVARDTAICVGGTVDLATLYTQDAASGTITYYANYADALNKTSAITATVTPSVTSEYFIRKELATGCFDIDSINVTVNALPSAPTVAVTQPTCSVTTGTITVNTPSSGVTYSFDNGVTYQASNIKSGLAASTTYQVVVKDNTSTCVSTATPSVLNAQPATPVISSVAKTDPSVSSCPALNDGTITVTATGSNLEYSKDNGATWQASNEFTGLTAGSYTIKVRNSVGNCEATYGSNPVDLTAPDCNVMPVITSTGTATTPENITTTTPVYTATATDANSGQTLTFSFETGGADNALFTINPTTGAVTFNTSPDFENPTDAGGDNVYNIKVKVCDNGTPQLCATKDVAITVTDVLECDTPSVGGTTATTATLPLCTTSNSGTISLSGHTGLVVKWQTSTNGGTSWTDIANTTTTYSFTNAANNQQYRAVVNSGGICVDATSSATTITASLGACTVRCDVPKPIIISN
jgi:hypothetical protein